MSKVTSYLLTFLLVVGTILAVINNSQPKLQGVESIQLSNGSSERRNLKGGGIGFIGFDDDDYYLLPVIDPVRVCVTYGNTTFPNNNIAWSVRTDTQDGTIIARGPGQDDNCRIVEIEIGRPYWFAIHDKGGTGQVTAFVSNNGEILVEEIMAVPETIRVGFQV